MYTLLDFFRETIFPPLGGPTPLHFYMYYRFTKACYRKPQVGRGSPKKDFNRENLKFAVKFRVLDEITSVLVGVSSRDFLQSMSREAGVIIWAKFLQFSPQKICDGKKNVQNFARFLTTFDFDREYLRNGSTYQKSET